MAYYDSIVIVAQQGEDPYVPVGYISGVDNYLSNGPDLVVSMQNNPADYEATHHFRVYANKFADPNFPDLQNELYDSYGFLTAENPTVTILKSELLIPAEEITPTNNTLVGLVQKLKTIWNAGGQPASVSDPNLFHIGVLLQEGGTLVGVDGSGNLHVDGSGNIILGS